MKKNFKIKYIVFAVIGLLIVGIAVFVLINWNNLVAIYGGVTNTKEEIVIKQKDNDAKIDDLVKKVTGRNMTVLPDSLRKKLDSGELSEADAIEIILGNDYGKWVANEAETGAPAGEGKSQTAPPQKSKSSSKERIVAKIYLLRSEYTGKIDSLISKGKSAVKALPPGERTASKLYEVADNLIDAGIELEKNCDAQMEEYLSELEDELKASGEDTSVVSEIRSAYESEKQLKKEELFNTYYPKD